MRTFYLIYLLFCFQKSNGQNFALSYNEIYFKTTGYLEICTDQMYMGLFKKINDFNFDMTFLDSIEIVPLKSSGFNEGFLFYKLLIKYPNEVSEMSYSFCYVQENWKLYKLKGFFHNDFYSFFQYLQTKGYKINTKYFINNNIRIDNIDFDCLIKIYNTKKNKSTSEREKSITPCLNYNFQPVIIH